MASRRTKRSTDSRPLSQSPPPPLSAPATDILSSNLRNFRRWLDSNGATIHPSLCIVNGEANDGTKNAPVYAAIRTVPPISDENLTEEQESKLRIHHEHYSGSTGCTVRTVKEIKVGETTLEIPRGMMVTPDLATCSDAGRSVLECIDGMLGDADAGGDYRSMYLAKGRTVLARTAALVSARLDQGGSLAGNALLVNILRARKRAEDLLARAYKEMEAEGRGEGESGRDAPVLAEKQTVSDRAPLLAFLLQQRSRLNAEVFSDNEDRKSFSVPGETYPDSFHPYIMMMPPAVSIPISWSRTDLRILSQSISGITLLQETAAHTHVLAGDLLALINAGWLKKFKAIGVDKVTWDDWVWAAGLCMSRTFPIDCFKRNMIKDGKKDEEKMGIDKKRKDDGNEVSDGGTNEEKEEDPWDDLGVMIPFLDMFNHEPDSAQIKWETNSTSGMGDSNGVGFDIEQEAIGPSLSNPRGILHKRAKKNAVVYNSYGLKSNLALILDYGFAQVNNPNDELGVGWGLSDAVGGPDVVPPDPFNPLDFGLVSAGNAEVFESTDTTAKHRWWTLGRLRILRRVAGTSDYEHLKQGRKLHVYAYNDGHLHPLFLNVAVAATMPPEAVEEAVKEMDLVKKKGEKEEAGEDTEYLVPIGPLHLRVLHNYLVFFLTRKLEKLLINLDGSIKTNYQCNLWTKATEGGLNYTETVPKGETGNIMGWQQFFDTYGYNSAMEVEKKYYAVGPDSCVLALFDGHVRAIQKTIDGVTENSFSNVVEELKVLGFQVTEGEVEVKEEPNKIEADIAVENGKSKYTTSEQVIYDETCKIKDSENESKNVQDNKSNNSKKKGKDDKNEKEDKDNEKAPQDRVGSNDGNSNTKKAKKSVGGNAGNNNGNRKPPLKLHIGNLAYITTPSNLFEYFAEKYGRENVLECHIPTERETGKSRGFGFVTMPESIARAALVPDQKHEVDNRLLKVAESNTAGSNRRNRNTIGAGICGGGGNNNMQPSDRCGKCGYRPKYCNCAEPAMGGGGYSLQHAPRDFGPGHYNMPPGGPWYPDHYGDWRGPPPPMGWNYGRRSYSRSPSPYARRHDFRGGGGGGGVSDRYDDYDRWRRRRSYDSRSRSPSYSKDRGRREKRHRGYSRRSRSRSRSRHSRSRSSSRGRSYRRDHSGGDTSRRGRGGSRSRSISRDNRSSKKRRRSDHRSRSRSRSRSKDRSSRRDSGRSSRSKRDKDVSRKDGKRSGGRSWSKDRSGSGSRSRSKV